MPAADEIYVRIPVRAIFKGFKKNSIGDIEPFEHWYEFSRFRTDIISSDVFYVN